MNRALLIVLVIVVASAAGGGLWWWQSHSNHDGHEGYRQSAGDTEMTGRYRAGPYRLGVALEPEATRTGRNRLVVELTDAGDQPVADAELRGVAVMPAMGAMAEMRSPVEFEEQRPGVYAGNFELQMRGEWPLTLEIAKPGVGEARLGFDMATGRRGLQIASGGSSLDTPSPPPSLQGGEGENAGEGPVITIDARRRQMIGVKTGVVEYRSMSRSIRAVGRVVYDETALSDITLRFDAWIGDLKADFVGTQVKRGQTLFTVYSPELLAAQQEYLSAWQRGSRLAYGGEGLVNAARKRLKLWDISPAQIRALEQHGEPWDYLPIASSRNGTVVEKNIVAGSAVKAGQVLMRVADLSRVWVDAEIYEAELPLVAEGMAAEVTLPYLPEQRFDARVEYVYPYLEGDSRTARLRLTLDNPQGTLKPDMYAQVTLHAELGERLVVPRDAVLVAGESRVVFRDLGEGRLQPVRVETGQRNAGHVEILSGLEAGDRIVTSGTFLLAAETQLKTGIEQW